MLAVHLLWDTSQYSGSASGSSVNIASQQWGWLVHVSHYLAVQSGLDICQQQSAESKSKSDQALLRIGLWAGITFRHIPRVQSRPRTRPDSQSHVQVQICKNINRNNWDHFFQQSKTKYVYKLLNMQVITLSLLLLSWEVPLISWSLDSISSLFPLSSPATFLTFGMAGAKGYYCF